jgi:hypothetical protein
MKQVVITLLAAFATFAQAEDENNSPSRLISTFIANVRAGYVEKAEAMFSCYTDEQRQHVHSYVTNAVRVFSTPALVSEPIATFVSTNCAVVAIQQTHTNFPGIREIEDGYLIKTPAGWRLLPNCEDYGVPINIPPVTFAIGNEYRALTTQYYELKRAERKKDKNRISEQPPVGDVLKAAPEE